MSLKVEIKAQKIFRKEIVLFVNKNWKENNLNLSNDYKELDKSAQLFGRLIDDPRKGEKLRELMVFINKNMYNPTNANKAKVLRILSQIKGEDYVRTIILNSKPEMDTRIKSKLGPLKKLRDYFSRN